jgi:hypothetical protein
MAHGPLEQDLVAESNSSWTPLLKLVTGILKRFLNPAQQPSHSVAATVLLGCHAKSLSTLKMVASIARSPSTFRRRKTIRATRGTMLENPPTAKRIRMVDIREKKGLMTEQKRALAGQPAGG